jgi:hypothetical protein
MQTTDTLYYHTNESIHSLTYFFSPSASEMKENNNDLDIKL